MSTPHNRAENGDFAKLVLMPGDPLRAKIVADEFLEDVVMVNDVRNMFGYTGYYKGNKVSVMGSGMGMPSIGLYAYELYTMYGVEAIIRIGSTGSMKPDMKLFDVVLGTSAYTESSFAKQYIGWETDTMYPDEALNNRLREKAKEQNVPLYEGVVYSSDIFYFDPSIQAASVDRAVNGHNCCAAEMESYGLFTIAKSLNKQAACLLTVSDSLLTHEVTTSEDRQNRFRDMMRVALELAEDYQ